MNKGDDFVKNIIYALSFSLCFFLMFPPSTLAQSDAELLEFLEFLEAQDDNLNLFGTSSLIENITTAQNPRNLSHSPSTIKPGDRVTVSLVDYGRSASALQTDWYVNGRLHTSGIGIREISLTAGRPGVATTVYVDVFSLSGIPERTAPITIGAAHVDLLWEAVDAKAPPFYKGKALPSWDTIIKLHAVPEMYGSGGVSVPPSTFVYTWEKNSRLNDLNNQSGYGKDSAFALVDFTRKRHHFRASVSNTSHGISSGGSVTVGLRDPEVFLYEKHPLGGVIFERALTQEVTQPAAGGSLLLVAYPFGLDSRNKNNVSYEWKMNGRTINNTAGMMRGEIPLISSGTAGSTNIYVNIKNDQKSLQVAETALRVLVE